MIRPGRYKHYKGGTYRVLFTALDTDSNTEVVVYINETHGTYYTRPLNEFTEDVAGTPRFKLLDDISKDSPR